MPERSPGALILPYQGVLPQIDGAAWVAPGATVIGDTVIGAGSSIWFGCVLRGDVAPIRIGARVNVQDGTVIHVSRHNGGTVIGDGVTIGHMALIHACELESGSFIGMGAVVLDNAVVESGAMVAAGALVSPRKRVRQGELWAGRPARLMRALTDADRAMIIDVAASYAKLAQRYRAELA